MTRATPAVPIDCDECNYPIYLLLFHGMNVAYDGTITSDRRLRDLSFRAHVAAHQIDDEDDCL